MQDHERHDSQPVDLARITQRLGLPDLELPQAKSGLRSVSYQELYGDAERRIVASVCRDEIERFGYSF